MRHSQRAFKTRLASDHAVGVTGQPTESRLSALRTHLNRPRENAFLLTSQRWDLGTRRFFAMRLESSAGRRPESRAPEMPGASVAFNGTRLTVGAPLDPGFGSSTPGATYVLDYRGRKWNQTGALQSALAQRLDGYGFTVAQSGDLVGVAALMQPVTNTVLGGYALTI